MCTLSVSLRPEPLASEPLSPRKPTNANTRYSQVGHFLTTLYAFQLPLMDAIQSIVIASNLSYGGLNDLCVLFPEIACTILCYDKCFQSAFVCNLTICMANSPMFICIQIVIVGPGLAVYSPSHLRQNSTTQIYFTFISLLVSVHPLLSILLFCLCLFHLYPFYFVQVLTGKYSCTHQLAPLHRVQHLPVSVCP